MTHLDREKEIKETLESKKLSIEEADLLIAEIETLRSECELCAAGVRHTPDEKEKMVAKVALKVDGGYIQADLR